MGRHILPLICCRPCIAATGACGGNKCKHALTLHLCCLACRGQVIALDIVRGLLFMHARDCLHQVCILSDLQADIGHRCICFSASTALELVLVPGLIFRRLTWHHCPMETERAAICGGCLLAFAEERCSWEESKTAQAPCLGPWPQM